MEADRSAKRAADARSAADLQELIARYGGYDRIPSEAWAVFDRAQASLARTLHWVFLDAQIAGRQRQSTPPPNKISHSNHTHYPWNQILCGITLVRQGDARLFWCWLDSVQRNRVDRINLAAAVWRRLDDMAQRTTLSRWMKFYVEDHHAYGASKRAKAARTEV